MSQITLVDDDVALLASLSNALEAEGFDVKAYSNGPSMLQGIRNSLPDLAILDITMPEMDGIELLQNIRRDSMVPVIFLTARDEEIDEVLGLRMGADDYVKKPFSHRVLLERIKALLRRVQVGHDNAAQGADGHIMVRGPLSIDPICHKVVWAGHIVALTVTEFQLLQALAEYPGHVKSRDQLMNVIYDGESYVDDRTIDSHIKRLRKKMRKFDPNFMAIETLYGVGYRYNQPEDSE